MTRIVPLVMSVGPVINMLHQCTDHLLRADDLFQVLVRLRKKLAQPFFAATGTGKIEFMKNGKFLFRVEDGNVIE